MKGLGLVLLAATALSGCHMPGRPAPGPEVPRPESVMSFAQLYGENCSGCHGADGRNGSAMELGNPVYLAIIDDAALRNIIANGEKGTLMPGFGNAAGGSLTDKQIDALVSGMRARWAKPNVLAGMTAPPWKASQPGDATHGAAVYTQACARCHGNTSQQPGAAGSILDGSFLALVNDQTIRTIVIAGRDDIGQPDWRNVLLGRALTDAEITDLTAWLIAQTPPHPGHPYPSTQPTAERPGEQQPLATHTQ
ncbi:c-type cytochrome [Terriglobus albidus]|uniref:c-type cytochrome n=1 Tax=Terriglobus albidus TaxID=1592106 RepID=UPI0021DF843E|nr:cytochrome c [Terriglobus albidus]